MLLYPTCFGKHLLALFTYIGIITPEGVIKSEKKKISLSGIEVREYGFSKAVWQLCPQGWKKPPGNDWEDVLSIIL